MHLTKLKLVGLVALASCAVSACEIQRAQEASDAKKGMVGLPKERVLQCMGSPARTAAVGYTEVWTYESGNNRTDSFGYANAWGGYGWANAFGSSTSSTRSCKIDVVMEGGQVSRINYSGDTGGWLTKGEQCGFAIDNCARELATRPPGPDAFVSPAPTMAVSQVEAPADEDSSPPTPRRCTQQDREMAQLAKEQGYQYHTSCQ